ncbi:MAG TPA: hypothetical protein VG122_10080 [Gemmata sp.]|jgi:uncharacterized protein involved in exopolysaccharide biosynthesis|nr:hypothetical protein [Gemmata sp.]
MSTAELPTDAKTKSCDCIDVRVVFHAVWRHPLAFLGLIFLASLPVAGVWYFSTPPKYSAAAVFHISSQPQLLLSSQLENRDDFTMYKQSQMALIKSRRVLNAALKEPEIRDLNMVRTAQPDRLTWQDNALTVETDSNRFEFMRATIIGEDAEELLALLNAVVKAYLAVANERDNSVRNRRQEELEKSYIKVKEELRKLQNMIDEIARALGSRDGATLAFLDAFHRDSLRDAVRDHASLREELDLAESNLSAVKNALKRPAIMAVVGAVVAATLPQGGQLTPQVIPPATIEEELRRDTVLQEFELAVGRARKALKDIEAVLPPESNSPQILNVRATLKAAEGKRDKYYNEARAKVEALLKEKLSQNEEARVALMQAECDRLKARVDRAASKIHELQKEISKSNIYKIDLENLKSEIAQKEKVCSLLADEIERLKIEGKAPARVTVMEEPFIVGKVEENRRWPYALLASLTVFLVGFGGLVRWEYRNRRVTPSSTTPS